MKFPIAALAVLVLVSCSDDPVCDRGESRACACPSGDDGAQVCAEDLQGWLACVCEGVDADADADADQVVDADLDGDGDQADVDGGCDDDDPCTVDFLGSDGACVHAAAVDGTDCEGAFFCRVGEVCIGGHCNALSGSDACGGDGNSCVSSWSCDEETDTCDFIPAWPGTHCEGADYCRVALTCDGAGACDLGSGYERDCDDDNACTDDDCDEDANECTHVTAPEGTSCIGVFFCRVDTTCDAAGACDVNTGAVRDCSDGFSCTVDSCSEPDRSCTHLPNHTLCTEPGLNYCDPTAFDADPETGCASAPGGGWR